MKLLRIYEVKRCSGVTAIFLVSALASSFVCAHEKPTDHSVVNFLPVNISFECQPDTPKSFRVIYPRSSTTTPGVGSVECVDKRYSVDNIYPLKVEVVYRKIYGMWSLVIVMDPKDASIANSVSSKNVGRNMLIGVDHRVFTKSVLLAPLAGQRLYITVNSEKFGDDLSEMFVDSRGGG